MKEERKGEREWRDGRRGEGKEGGRERRNRGTAEGMKGRRQDNEEKWKSKKK